jgi:hypothetical protein
MINLESVNEYFNTWKHNPNHILFTYKHFCLIRHLAIKKESPIHKNLSFIERERKELKLCVRMLISHGLIGRGKPKNLIFLDDYR